jgi:hypothetical protein
MSIAAMKQALEALTFRVSPDKELEAIAALRQAIEQEEKQEPVAWISEPMVAAVRRANPEWYGKWQAELTCTQMFPHQIPLYTAPPKREWVGLTDEEISNCWINPVASGTFTKRNVYEAIEAKLKEKNT